MKLQQRMLLYILVSIFIILTGLILYIGQNNKQTAETNATQLATASGEKIALSVQKDLETAMDTSRTLANSLEGLQQNKNANRDMVSSMLKQVVMDNPSFLGSWTVWEPNAFDNQDQKYANTDGTDATGRLIPYWSRTGDTISLAPNVDYEKPGAGDYYLLARNSGEETIINPYVYKINGKDVLMTSLVVPIKKDNKVVGVTGVDINLDQLQSMASQFKLYDTGYATIYSNNGAFVTSSKPEQIGKKISEVSQDSSVAATMKNINDGVQFKEDVTDTYKLFTPIHIGHSKTPWSVGISIPMKEITAESSRMLTTTVIAAILALLLLAAIVYFSTNAIVRPIAAAVSIGETMAQGDFTKQIPSQYRQRKDEIGTLARVLEQLTESMKSMIGHVGINASQVAAASQQISASAEELARGSTNQAHSAQQISELFNELSKAIHSVARNAEQAAELANGTLHQAEDGGKVVQKAIEGMNHVSQQMARLEQDSHTIGDIIEVIDEIAEQTNLLALNAAIEAARAGEQGKGFAVVAEEVRKLAERSSEATKQISQIITSMQRNTKESVDSVAAGVNQSLQTGEAFKQIMAMINGCTHKVTEIAAASEEQSAQAEEVLMSVSAIAATSQQSAAASEETAASSQSLAHLAEELNSSISRFKVS